MKKITKANVKLIEEKPTGKTLGELRVFADFNSDREDDITIIKNKAAELINLVEGIKMKEPRLAALAQTSFEEGVMWAVKLATA